MKFTACLLACLALPLLFSAELVAADSWAWPALFPKKNAASSKDANASWWAAEQPKFSSPKPEVKPSSPSMFSKVGSGGKRLYSSTLGRVIPKKKTPPKPVTGHNTAWTRNKPPEKSSGGWFGSKKPKAPATLNEWFKLERQDP